MIKKNYTFLFCLLFSGSLLAQDLVSNLILDLPLRNEIIDESDYENPIQIFGTSLVPDRFGVNNQAISFSSSNDFLEIPHFDSLSFSQGDEYSISIWIKSALQQSDLANVHNDIISKWVEGVNSTPSLGYPFAIRMNNITGGIGGTVNMQIFDSYNAGCANVAKMTSPQPLNDGEWHHLVFIRTSENILKMYVDSFLEKEIQDFTTCSFDNSSPLRIGKRGATLNAPDEEHTYKGAIDDIKIYRRALTASEIEILFEEASSSNSEAENLNKNSLFPNPSEGLVFISGDDFTSLKVFNSSGKIILSQNAKAKFIDLNKLSSGIYFVELFNQHTGLKEVKRVIKL